MRFTIVTIILLLAACGALLIVSVPPEPASAAPSVRVTFLGYTNDASAALFARFAVTNASLGSVIRHVGYQVQTPATTPGRWANVSDGWFTGQANLPAGASEMVSVVVPTNLPIWRLKLTVMRDEPIKMLVRSLAAEIYKIGPGCQSSGQRSSGYYAAVSDAIHR